MALRGATLRLGGVSGISEALGDEHQISFTIIVAFIPYKFVTTVW